MGYITVYDLKVYLAQTTRFHIGVVFSGKMASWGYQDEVLEWEMQAVVLVSVYGYPLGPISVRVA